jgi:uncharacterized membrane protein
MSAVTADGRADTGRTRRGESRWPAAAAIVVAIALQIALPEHLVPPLGWLLPGLDSRWLLPGLELAALLVLIVVGPSRVDRESRALRATRLTLTGLLSLVNGWSATWLVLELVHDKKEFDAGSLLGTGAAIWLTNIIAFGLWYWQFDCGGPAARTHAHKVVPDFQFVQMQNPEPAGRDWKPEFIDYLYLSFTNATAFSPTDVMPLSRWAKMTMLAQSLISLITVTLVIARAINVLK